MVRSVRVTLLLRRHALLTMPANADPDTRMNSRTLYRLTTLCFLIAVTVAIVMSILTAPSFAQSRAAAKCCLRGATGSNACLYRTFDQCRTAAHGTGATCMRNSRYRGS